MKQRAALAALVAVVLLLAAPAPAFPFGKNKILYQRFDWKIYKAPHFDVYYYPASEPLLDAMVSYAESQYLRLSQAFDHEIKFRIPLIYYKTHVEFEQTNIALGFLPEWVGAFAEPIENRMVIPADEPPDKLYALIGHELTHVFEYSILFQESLSRTFRGQTPLWIMEGLASHMGRDEDNFDRMIIRDAVVNGLLPPIHRLNTLTFLTYRYGQAAFDFIEERYGPEGIRNFMWEFRKSLLTNNIEKPIKDAFGLDADEFDRQFRKFLQKRYLPTLLEKKEAEDYGKEIANKKEKERAEATGTVWFSPALSPSGELIAVMTNRWQDLDVAIVSAKDGKVFRNLTKGFTNKYEYLVYGAFQGKKDICWSPEGDRVAFFARKENERVLLIYNALRGNLEKMISLPGVDDELSPAWSPDGKWIAFQGNRGGVVDIFAYSLETKEIRNLTQDEFYDSNPCWSADGTQILYSRRINAYEKAFTVDVADPTRKIQLTFGDSSDLQPAYSHNGKSVYYVSDEGGGIFNLHSLSLETGEIRRLTNVVGGIFTPLQLPDENGKENLAFTSYEQGRFRMFRMTPGEPEAIERPADQAKEPAELQPFQPPVRLALDEDKKVPYDKIRYHVENAPTVLVGVADDGTVLGNAQVMLSDMLGDHRMLFNFQSVSTFSNFFYEYLNLRNRWNWSLYALDSRDYYFAQSAFTGNVQRTRQESSFTGAGAEISYPLNRYYRIGATAGAWRRSIDRPFFDASTGNTDFLSLTETYPTIGWSFDGDTTRFKEFGPFHGQRFQFSQEFAPTVSASGNTDQFRSGRFLNSILDYRLYRHVSARSLFAMRLAQINSSGQGYSIYSYGGLNMLRGYEFREFIGNRIAFANFEFRFPILDAAVFPFGALRDIRGFLFFDVGAAWFSDGTFYDPNLGQAVGASVNGQVIPGTVARLPNGQVAPRRFHFYDSDNHQLGDGRGSYGFGWNFYLGPFQLTWTFAKQLPNTIQTCEVDPSNPSNCAFTRIDDPFHQSGTVNQFYIAREF